MEGCQSGNGTALKADDAVKRTGVRLPHFPPFEPAEPLPNYDSG